MWLAGFRCFGIPASYVLVTFWSPLKCVWSPFGHFFIGNFAVIHCRFLDLICLLI
nr:MAG TPA: hypothetical protein [Caudoviricetes sp.]